MGKPHFVIEIDPSSRRVVIGSRAELDGSRIESRRSELADRTHGIFRAMFRFRFATTANRYPLELRLTQTIPAAFRLSSSNLRTRWPQAKPPSFMRIRESSEGAGSGRSSGIHTNISPFGPQIPNRRYNRTPKPRNRLLQCFRTTRVWKFLYMPKTSRRNRTRQR